jgi:hypothetical protein
MDARVTRREWLRHVGLAAAWPIGGQRRMKTRSGREAVDHLLLGTSDLESTVAWFLARSGVKPVLGGVHPGRGTRNALVSLGGGHYLEIIAPDPAQTVFYWQIDLRKVTAPTLVNWAVTSDDLETVVRVAANAKYAVYGPDEGARTRPDGSQLLWRTVGVLAPFRDASVDPMPFFIQWGRGVTHPSMDSPAGCRLVALELRHRQPSLLRDALALFGIEANVAKGDRPGLRATLDTPRGRLTI